MCSAIGFKYRPQQYVVDGLNSLRYKLVTSEPRPLYTWLLVTLPPHPTYFKGNSGGSLSRSVCMYSAKEFYSFVLVSLCVMTQYLQM